MANHFRTLQQNYKNIGWRWTQCCRQLSVLRIPNAKIRQDLGQYGGGAVDLHMDNTSGLATITMNNPDVRNAFTGKMMVDLDDCVRELENWSEGKGVILTGNGPAFCSGGDLNFVKRILDKDKGYNMSVFMHDVTMRLYTLPLISVSSIEGSALGGGAELTTACDFRVMAHDAKIAFFHVKLHVVPAWGGATRLVNLIGRTRALQLLTSGKIVTTEVGQQINIVDAVAPENENTLNFTKEWLLKNCVGDPGVIGVVKSMVVGASSLDVTKSLALERELFSKAWGSPDHSTAVKHVTNDTT